MKHSQCLVISTFCVALAWMVLPSQLLAQLPTSLPPQQDTMDYNRIGLTLHEIMAAGESRLAVDDTSEGGPRARHHSWNTFWSARAYKNDSSGVNMFDQYAKALNMDALAKTTQTCGTSNTFQGKWRSLGPKSFSNQTLGRVEDIWANPANINHMLAATNGGLFKSINKGQSWTCITDNANLPFSMVTINSVAVHPQNTDIIYLGSANHNDPIIGKFG